ncbi:AAA family ATPase [Corynebacterium incognita]|uniref:AAA family ATPase n=1 Tax=Corynebacterium incognita TaxID=2754725 RepID=A0A7G7CQP3_9CORY|nr:AAA family ATPase [Corynebacterium incognita]QNE89909.1 AAA family ATPase [Corynebacterium incognita]
MFYSSARIRDLKPGERAEEDFSFSLPAVCHLRARGLLEFRTPVTVFVGPNGAGKSTLLEALAISAGFPDAGGPLADGPAGLSGLQSSLHKRTVLRPVYPVRPPLRGFFLRADTHSELVGRMVSPKAQAGFNRLPPSHHLQHRSHGESVMDILAEHVDGAGIYFFDEPESGLSVIRQMALLAEIDQAVTRGGQFFIATHSPILLGIPRATILEVGDDGIVPIAFEDTEAVRATREFLADPSGVVKYVTAPDVEYLGD